MDDIKGLINRLWNDRAALYDPLRHGIPSDLGNTIKEAAEALENLDAQLDVIVTEDIEAQQELTGYRALGTLEHLQGIVEAPMPLTLDELRNMDGEPVWIKSLTGESGRWGLVSPFRQATTGKLYVYTYDTRHGERRYSDQEYGMVWIAYRRKPKEEQYAND